MTLMIGQICIAISKYTPNNSENEFQNWNEWVFRVTHIGKIVEYSLGGVFKPGLLGVFVIETCTFSSLVLCVFHLQMLFSKKDDCSLNTCVQPMQIIHSSVMS